MRLNNFHSRQSVKGVDYLELVLTHTHNLQLVPAPNIRELTFNRDQGTRPHSSRLISTSTWPRYTRPP